MPKFSRTSAKRLETCHHDIQRVCLESIKYVDFTVLEGHRDKERQNYLYEIGQTTLRWPYGNHNSSPSQAVDVAPWPIDWKDIRRFISVVRFIQGIGYGMGIPLRIGGDWNQDFVFNENFYDWPHLELLRPS